jgi:hypothetical protein
MPDPVEMLEAAVGAGLIRSWSLTRDGQLVALINPGDATATDRSRYVADDAPWLGVLLADDLAKRQAAKVAALTASADQLAAQTAALSGIAFKVSDAERGAAAPKGAQVFEVTPAEREAAKPAKVKEAEGPLVLGPTTTQEEIDAAVAAGRTIVSND